MLFSKSIQDNKCYCEILELKNNYNRVVKLNIISYVICDRYAGGAPVMIVGINRVLHY